MIKDELKEWVNTHREELDDKELLMGHEMRLPLNSMLKKNLRSIGNF